MSLSPQLPGVDESKDSTPPLLTKEISNQGNTLSASTYQPSSESNVSAVSEGPGHPESGEYLPSTAGSWDDGSI